MQTPGMCIQNHRSSSSTHVDTNKYAQMRRKRTGGVATPLLLLLPLLPRPRSSACCAQIHRLSFPASNSHRLKQALMSEVGIFFFFSKTFTDSREQGVNREKKKREHNSRNGDICMVSGWGGRPLQHLSTRTHLSMLMAHRLRMLAVHIITSSVTKTLQ